MRFIYTTIFIFSLFLSINAQTCHDLPESFKSYNQALSKIESATFLIKESVDCSESSWIQSSTFYSCDGRTGFFILRTKEGQEFIHQNVPIGIWKQFKNVSSFGSFYNSNIKGKYQLYISE